MYGINVGRELGKRALLARHFSLNAANQNITNADTPGFTRQQAPLNLTLPMSTARGNYGSGAEATSIRRLRSLFIDEQYREQSQSLGCRQSLQQGWDQIERIYGEPLDIGYKPLMNNFWNLWREPATGPETEAARVAIVPHVEDSRQALEGISMDEEMANMIKFEYAYEPAGRVITAIDKVLNTIIDNKGLIAL